MFKAKIVDFKPHTMILNPFLKIAVSNIPIRKIAVAPQKLRKIAENCGKLRKIADITEKLRKLRENCGPQSPLMGLHCDEIRGFPSLFKSEVNDILYVFYLFLNDGFIFFKKNTKGKGHRQGTWSIKHLLATNRLIKQLSSN